MVKHISQSKIENNKKLTPEQKEKLKERLYRKYVVKRGIGRISKELSLEKVLTEIEKGVNDPYYTFYPNLPIPCLANYHEGVQKRLLAVGVDQTGTITPYDKSTQKGIFDEQEKDRIINTLSNFVLDLNIRSAFIVVDNMTIIKHVEKGKICILKYTPFKDDNHFLFNDEKYSDFQEYKNPNVGYLVISLSKERDDDAIAIANFYDRVGANVAVSLVEQKTGKRRRGLKSKRQLTEENKQLSEKNKKLKDKVEELEERIDNAEKELEEREKQVRQLKDEMKRIKEELEKTIQELSATRQTMYEKERANNKLLDTIYRIKYILQQAGFGSRGKTIQEVLNVIDSIGKKKEKE